MSRRARNEFPTHGLPPEIVTVGSCTLLPLTIDKRLAKHRQDHISINSEQSLLFDKSVCVSVLREEFQSSSC